jgi:hypothetical protein
MKKNTALFLMVLGLFAAVGCSQEEAEPAEAQEAVEAAEPVAEPTAAEPAAAAPSGGDGVCGKAADCCTAYIAAMADTPAGQAVAAQGDAACQGVRQAGQAGSAGEPACTQAIAGWRQGLTAMNIAVPAACAE